MFFRIVRGLINIQKHGGLLHLLSLNTKPSVPNTKATVASPPTRVTTRTSLSTRLKILVRFPPSGSGKLRASPQSTPGSFASLYTPPGTLGQDQNDQGRQLMEHTGQGQQSMSQPQSQDMKKLKLAPPPELVLQPGSPSTPTNENPFSLGGKIPIPAGGKYTMPTTATPNSVLTPTTTTITITITITTPKTGKFIPRIKFAKKLSGFTPSSASSSPAPTPTSEIGSGTSYDCMQAEWYPGEKEKLLFRKSWCAGMSSSGSGSRDSIPTGASGENNVGTGMNSARYKCGASNDIVGIAMLDIHKADGLPG